MRAVVIDRPGGPEVLQLRELPDPRPAGQEVVVRVRAAALNRADLLQRLGRYPAPPDAPADVPGLEFAGEVELCGDRVLELEPGRRVMGILGGGGYAERVRVHERMCLAVPAGLDWAAAAALPEAFLTAHDALFRQGALAAGQVVLLPAAASGVGTAAAQLVAAAGARVIGLTRSAEKRPRLEELGLWRVLDASRDDLAEAIGDLAPGGVDLVLDLVGGAAWPLHLSVLRPRGRLVLIGLLGGARAEVDLGRLLTGRLTVSGSMLRSRPIEEKIALTREFERLWSAALAEGRLVPVVDRTFALERAAEAHAHMESNAAVGKIVLRMDGS